MNQTLAAFLAVAAAVLFLLWRALRRRGGCSGGGCSGGCARRTTPVRE